MALSELIARRQEMSTRQTLSVFCGTWNVNGGKNINNIAFKHENSFEEWLYSQASGSFFFYLGRFMGNNFAGDCPPTYDIVAIGLEEIVDLNASNMMKAR